MKILRGDEEHEGTDPPGPVSTDSVGPAPPGHPPSPLVALPLLPALSRFFTDAFRRRRIDDLNEPYTATIRRQQQTTQMTLH